MSKWTCLKCCEIVDASYEVCWICGTSREGFEDPTFVTADEAGPIYDPLRDRRHDDLPDPVEELPEPPPRLTRVFASQDIVTVRHVVQELQALGIPALAGPYWNVYAQGECVLVRSEDRVRAGEWVERFLKQRQGRATGGGEVEPSR